MPHEEWPEFSPSASREGSLECRQLTVQVRQHVWFEVARWLKAITGLFGCDLQLGGQRKLSYTPEEGAGPLDGACKLRRLSRFR